MDPLVYDVELGLNLLNGSSGIKHIIQIHKIVSSINSIHKVVSSINSIHKIVIKYLALLTVRGYKLERNSHSLILVRGRIAHIVEHFILEWLLQVRSSSYTSFFLHIFCIYFVAFFLQMHIVHIYLSQITSVKHEKNTYKKETCIWWGSNRQGFACNIFFISCRPSKTHFVSTY